MPFAILVVFDDYTKIFLHSVDVSGLLKEVVS